jgi:hypothetical protein
LSQSEESKSKVPKRKYRWLRRLGRVFLGILLFLILLVLFIRSPWGQDIIVGEAVKFVEGKTGTEFDIDRAFITFGGNIQIDGLYMEDVAGDTLVYSRSLEADLPLWPIINGDGYGLEMARWDGLTARIKRQDTIDGFNYQFLMDAFATEPDTTTTAASQPLQLTVGDIELTNFDVTLNDQVEKLDAVMKFDRFYLSMDQLDLEEMIVDIDEVELKNAIVKYNKDTVTAVAKAEPDDDPNTDTTLAEAITDDANDSPLPRITAGNLKIDNAALGYESVVDGINLDSQIGLFETSISTANVGKSKFVVDFLDLLDSNIIVKMTTVKPPEPIEFEWPEFIITVNDVNLSNNDVLYTLDGAAVTPGTFNPNALQFEDIGLAADNIVYENAQASLEISELSGREGSGINVAQFSTNASMSDQGIDINDLNAQVNNNVLRGDVRMGYSSMKGFIEDPTSFTINAAIPRYSIDLADVFRFSPELRSNEYMLALSKRNLTGSLRTSGSMNQLEIPNLVTNWGNQTAIMASGSVSNATDPDNLYVNFPSIKMRSTRKDLINFVSEKDLGIQLPERFSLTGFVKGRVDDIEADATLTTTNGTINLDGGFKNQGVIAFNANATATDVDLGAILQDPTLGVLNLTIDARGSGATINDLDATIDANVNSFAYNSYEINNLPISGSFKNGNGEISSRYRDDNLDASLQSQIKLDSIASEANIDLNIEGIDMRAFGITNQNVRAAGKINAYYKGDFENYRATVDINDGIAVYDEQSYLLGGLNVSAFVQPDTTSVDVSNKMLDLRLRSNADPVKLAAAVNRHINRYLTDSVSMDTLKPVVMKVNGDLRPSPILRDVILPQLTALDTVHIEMDFNEMQRKLDADIVAPYVQYAGSEIDSLAISVRSDSTDLHFNVGFLDIEAGPIFLDKTNLDGRVAQNELVLDFISYHDEEKLMHVGSTLSRKRNQQGTDDLIFKINLEDLILNKKPWQIPDDNTITLGGNRLAFNNFNLTNGNQRIEVRDDLPDIEKNHVGIEFSNFKLQALLSYLNPEEKLATGNLNGEFVLEDIFNKMGFEADLSIEDFAVLETPLGRLDLDAQLVDNDLYEMDLAVKGDDVDLDVTGNYRALPQAADLNLDLDLNRLNMSTVTGIASDFLSDGSGSISGNMAITGTTADPVYDGQFNFAETGFNVNMLNADFVLVNEQLRFDNDGVYMNNFTVADASGNTFQVDGSVGLENLLNPTFDLEMEARNFTALNSTADDNDLYYGTATFDATASITGDATVPVVDMDLSVKDGTEFTYVMPAAETDIVQRDGIVQFVNKENPDDILTRTEEESVTLTGFDINADLTIRDGSKINVIVDPNTGDNLQLAGDGDLKFRMTPNGRMTLAGRYEIHDGFYELNLYEIVNRRFELVNGGSVSWSGDPFDAALDVSARYNVETSASALMASRTSGADATETQKFRQELPFLVFMNVDGELTAPVITFNLDMPEDEQGAIGGQVYSQVQQLNTQEQELNKQVFSLLVLNRFFPTSGSDGSSGGLATVARDNLNQALSDQLNQFGGKLLGDTGVELNFGLDSYTDYQGSNPQERTQLDVTASKKLLNDRLIVSVGSQVDVQGSPAEGEETPVIGNVSLEYLVTRSGRWRLKGFRKNQFDNVIDGQLIVSGIGVIFTREFNEFKNLFRKSVEDELDREERERKKNREKQNENQNQEDGAAVNEESGKNENGASEKKQPNEKEHQNSGTVVKIVSNKADEEALDENIDQRNPESKSNH